MYLLMQAQTKARPNKTWIFHKGVSRGADMSPVFIQNVALVHDEF